MKNFDQFDFGFQPSIDERQLQELRSLRFIHEASFDWNPNTGEPLNAHRRMVTATNTIYYDAAYSSQVLPLVN